MTKKKKMGTTKSFAKAVKKSAKKGKKSATPKKKGPSKKMARLLRKPLKLVVEKLQERKPKAEAVLDHFKVWTVKSVRFPKPVKLAGQFDDGPMPFNLTSIEWLANPVRKNGGKILHEDAHLIGYYFEPLEQPAPVRMVKLLNQFGEAEWTLGNPTMLLIPASKVFGNDPPAPPNTVDHFECYAVTGSKAEGRAVTLEDQFDVKLRKKEDIETLEPSFFGVPVSKNGEKIVNPKAHLSIYDITPRTTLKQPLTVSYRDQFGSGKLEALESIMLAVPCDKLSWKVVPATQVGRLTGAE